MENTPSFEEKFLKELESYVSVEKKKHKNLHENHRKRLDAKAERIGFDFLELHEQLEEILYVTIPRGDTNGIAHALLDKFGTLRGVLTAEVSELEKVKGVGRRTAVFLSQLNSIAGLIVRNQTDEKVALDTSEKIGKFISSYYIGKEIETSYMFNLDSNRRVKSVIKISEGVSDETYIYPQTVAKNAVRYGANMVIISHNHPGGTMEPSPQDIEITKSVEYALASVGVSLLDSVIVADGECFSLRENGFFYKLRWS